MAGSNSAFVEQNVQYKVVIATVFALVLSTTAVALRVLARRICRVHLKVDDYLMILALLFEWAISMAGVVFLHNGLGRHVSTITPAQLITYLKTLYTGSFLYAFTVTFTKLSILFLYARVFPTPMMRKACVLVGSIVVLWCTSVCIVGALICVPTEKLWHPTTPGGCIDVSKFYYGLQVPNILTDGIILIMPAKVIWTLPLSRPQRISLMVIFTLGALTLVFDIVRLVALVELSSEASTDMTFNQVDASVWTCIEPAIGITAACLSNMRPIFEPIFAKLKPLSVDFHEKYVRRPSSPQHSLFETARSKTFATLEAHATGDTAVEDYHKQNDEEVALSDMRKERTSTQSDLLPLESPNSEIIHAILQELPTPMAGLGKSLPSEAEMFELEANDKGFHR